MRACSCDSRSLDGVEGDPALSLNNLAVLENAERNYELAESCNEEHRDPEAVVASHAALDALVTFGSTTSPLVTFDLEKVESGLRPGQRGEGLWTWVHALRAKRWKHVYVAVRP